MYVNKIHLLQSLDKIMQVNLLFIFRLIFATFNKYKTTIIISDSDEDTLFRVKMEYCNFC